MSLASCRIHGRIIVDFYFISCIFIKFIQFFLLFCFHRWNRKDNLLNFIICKFFYGYIIFCPYRDSVDLSSDFFLADINKEGVEQVTADLQQKGCEVLSVVIDVTKESDIERMVSTAISAFGRLDILINNTGIFDMLVPVADTDDALWEKVLSINLTAPMRAIRYTIPIFKEQGGGVIVNTASIAGLTGARGGGAAYVASKHGLVGLTKHVAFCYKEWNIRCNAVAPGRVDTNIRDNSKKALQTSSKDGCLSEDMAKITEKIAMGYATNQRKAAPEEIAKVALFLASDEASFVNGSIFVADGAWTAY